MKRMMKLKLSRFAIAGALFAIALIQAPLIMAQKSPIKIMVTSDVHGRLFKEHGTLHRTSQSSLESVYAYVENARQSALSDIILLDNGDLMQGTPAAYFASYMDTGKPGLFSRVMNFMGYEAMTIGNHDIECGPKVYNRLQSELDFPLLGANVVKASDGKPFFQPYAIVEKGGLRIGILGLTTTGVPDWLPGHLWTGMEFRDMVESAKYWVDHIRTKEKPDLLIGLFHSGLGRSDAKPEDQPLENACAYVAKHVPGLDIIFTGHDHGRRNLWIQNTAGDSVLVLGPGHFAEHLAVATISPGKGKGRKASGPQISGELIEISSDLGSPEFRNEFSKDMLKVEQWSSTEVAELGYNIYAVESLLGPSPLTDLIHRVQLDYTGADISIAAPLSFDDTIFAGMLTNRDFFRLYEYENYLYTIQLSGQEIKDYLNYSYQGWVSQMMEPEDYLLDFHLNDNGQVDLNRTPRFRLKKPFFNCDGAAGIRYEVNVRRDIEDRIVIRSIEGQRLFHPDSTYKVAVNSYRGSGGGGHLTKGLGLTKPEINSRIIHTSDKELRSILVNFLQKNGASNHIPRAHWKFTPEEWTEEASKRDMDWLFREK